MEFAEIERIAQHLHEGFAPFDARNAEQRSSGDVADLQVGEHGRSTPPQRRLANVDVALELRKGEGDDPVAQRRPGDENRRENDQRQQREESSE